MLKTTPVILVSALLLMVLLQGNTGRIGSEKVIPPRPIPQEVTIFSGYPIENTQAGGNAMIGPALIIVVAVIVVLVVAVVSFLTRYYHKVPPSKVMVVYGKGAPRLITNGGVFVKPIVEQFKLLDITIMTIITEKDEVYTKSGVPIQLDWVAQVQIDSEEASLRTAARAFLDKTSDVSRLSTNSP